jgi:hypothetical protein
MTINASWKGPHLQRRPDLWTSLLIQAIHSILDTNHHIVTWKRRHRVLECCATRSVVLVTPYNPEQCLRPECVALELTPQSVSPSSESCSRLPSTAFHALMCPSTNLWWLLVEWLLVLFFFAQQRWSSPFVPMIDKVNFLVFTIWPISCVASPWCSRWHIQLFSCSILHKGVPS